MFELVLEFLHAAATLLDQLLKFRNCSRVQSSFSAVQIGGVLIGFGASAGYFHALRKRRDYFKLGNGSAGGAFD
jgi:hypothetical protein